MADERKQIIADVADGIMNAPEPAEHVPGNLILHPNGKPGKRGSAKSAAIQVRRPTRIMSARDQISRIQQDADPIGFLIDVMNGAVFEEHVVNDQGKHIKTVYSQASLSKRMDVARFLANKVLPSMSIQKHIVDPPETDPGKQQVDPSQRGANFAQIVSVAASKARAQQEGSTVQMPLDGDFTVVEEDEDGGQ